VKQCYTVLGITMAVGYLLVAPSVFAQGPPSLDVVRIEPTERLAMVKFICGTSTGGELAPGRYFTAINIAHLGTRRAQPVDLRMDVIRTNGTRATAESVAVGTIGGAQGLEVDCALLAALFKSDLTTDLLKGFVRFFGNNFELGDRMNRLEFVAVYSAMPAPQ